MTPSEDTHVRTRRMMGTAIRRLNVLEYVILGFAMALALAAGAVMAWVLRNATGASFRISWIVASLLFFAVPGFLVLMRERRSQTKRDGRDSSTTKRDDG